MPHGCSFCNLILAFNINFTVSNAFSSGLRSLNDCFCPGQEVSFECTVIGGGLTVWDGSAFMCQGEEITLLHQEFGTNAAIGECNNGETMISARGIRVVDTRYTSQLDVTLTPAVVGRTIICSSNDEIVGSTILGISTGELIYSFLFVTIILIFVLF